MKFAVFPRAAFAALLSASATLRAPAAPTISEFMASNAGTLLDEDGEAADWIEIHNPDPLPANLAGWHLTDSAKNRTKWTFPPITLSAGGYLVVFASGKDRRDAARPLHTNFSLDAGGEYLALATPGGSSVATEFAPAYPSQRRDVSYGAGGFFAEPTPGAPNAAPLLTTTVTFSRAPGLFADTIALELRGAGPGQRIRYILATPASVRGQVPRPTADSEEYRGPITLSASAVICAAVFSADDSASGAPAIAHYVKVNESVASFTSQLPVLLLDTLGTGPLTKDGIDHPSWLYAYSAQPAGGATFAAAPTQITPLTASVRGASSADFPKKGINLKLRDAHGVPSAQPILGLATAERWALVAPWAFDHSYVNNAFMYALSNWIGRWAPRTRFAEVFLNSDGGELDASDYNGVYVLTERIEAAAQRVAIAELSARQEANPEITGGYILKIDAPTEGEVFWRGAHALSENGESSLILIAPQAQDATEAQRDYIRDYVRRMETALAADHATGWKQRTSQDYIDRASWVDHHLLNTLACNPDAFVRSAYFTKDRGGRLQAGPVWDFDRALGSYSDGRSFRHDVWSGEGCTDVWRIGWWGLLAQDPEFMQDWIDRWQSLRRSELSDRTLVAVVEMLTAQIGSAAAARDAARWPDNASPHGNYTAQIARMKAWVTQRSQWIDAQFLAAPAVQRTDARLTFTPPEGAQLAYTLDGSDPRGLGGQFAPNAELTSASLTVDAQANVHVRSYRAELFGVFPGSPWSSAIGGPAASPLSPRARIVNLSSRARIGGGEDALIAGVVINDTTAKRYLARAIGPGLARFGAADAAPDPRLALFDRSGKELSHNRGWQSNTTASEISLSAQALGAFPLAADSTDSALLPELAAGAYTFEISTAIEQPGTALIELYESSDCGRTANLSTRARVHAGDGALVGGFVVQGPAYKCMLLRAIGPALAAHGVAQPLRDPVLTLYRGQQVVAANDRWSAQENVSAVQRAIAIAGAFALPLDSEDAALLVTLPPGAYTAEVRSKDGTSGVALLEIYDAAP